MLDQRRVAAQPDEKREQLFTERYESLLAWAMRLTNQQREAAEDLVQDAFVQFMLGRTRLEEIENIDGYLRRMLRYMHISRMSRSAQRLHEAALSVADYDSCRLGWTAIEPPRRMQAFEELQQICFYACSRKESSRAGSVLILRFFHDYFPTEIAAVLNSSRHCVDQWQRLARREVKVFLDEPARLRFVHHRARADKQPIKYLKSDCDLMLELRQMIFGSRQGDCLSEQALSEIYNGGNTEALTTAKLAHIVSCPTCLDAVNALLGLPLLAQRYRSEPADTNDPKEPPGNASGGGDSGGGPGDLTKKFAQRLRETHEHKPNELRIAIDGAPVSSLKVSSDLSELDLNLTPDNPIEFVEVSSEQGVQILFFSIDPAERQAEQWARIELSEGRFLEACFRNENGPTLHLIYKDPAPEAAHITAAAPHTLSSPLVVVHGADPLKEAKNALGVSRLRSWAQRSVSTISRAFGGSLVAAEATQQSQDHSLVDAFAGENTSFLKLSQAAEPSWRRLGWMIVLVSAIVIAGFLFFRASLSQPLTATTLLDKATVAEKSNIAVDQIRHRFINLEERRSAEGAIVAQLKIEVWENPATGARAQRLYDYSHHLIGGTWQKADGSRVVYHHGTKPQSQSAITSPDNLLLNLEDIWQMEPSAQSFAALISQPALAGVEERSTTYVLAYEKGRTIGATQLIRATLTLSKSDLHAIESTLIVQRSGELHEYRFVEASDERLPAKAVVPGAFEVEPELTGGAGETGRPGDWALRDLTSSRVPPSPSTSAPPVASAELEVDVAYLLNRAKADRNEQVNLTRSAGGSLRVEGVVESEQRRNELLQALAAVSNNPAVKIEIRTVAEATELSPRKGPVTLVAAQTTSNTIAVENELREYLSKKDPRLKDDALDEAVRSFSSHMVNRSYQLLFHAVELKRLVNRFDNVDMRTLAPDARAKWLEMLREHAIALERECATVRQELQAIFAPGTALNSTEELAIENDRDLARAVERLHQLTVYNNEAIRAALTVSQSSAAAIKSPQFWTSLSGAEKLAARIKRYGA